MIKRIVIFVICTVLSSWGIIASWGAATNLYNALFFEPINFTNTRDNIFLKFFICILFWSAWFYYLKISIKWIKYNSVEKRHRVIGATLGLTSVMVTAGYGFFFAIPSVMLMFYIHFNVPYARPA
jgi:hypothetical protein